MSQVLLKHTPWDLLVVSSKTHTSKNPRLHFGKLEDLKTVDVVFLVVSISAFESTIQKIAPFLKKKTVVIDVCSVKVLPAKIMKKHLPNDIELIATHPIFGPDTFAKNKGLQGLPIVLFQLRCQLKTFQKVVHFCQTLKLKTIEMSPEQHDRYVAYTQAYAFLVGKIGQKMKLRQTPIDTSWYSLLREQCQVVQRDSDQLFIDIQKYNPFAKEMRKKFKKTVADLMTEIEAETFETPS